jgi:hypothetical protein
LGASNYVPLTNKIFSLRTCLLEASTMKCPECEFENREGAKFCSECGHKYERICSECGTANRISGKFCDEKGISNLEDARLYPYYINMWKISIER